GRGRRPTGGGRRGAVSRWRSASCSRRRWHGCVTRSAPGKDGPRRVRRARRPRAGLNEWPSAVLSSSTAFSCSRGGEFLYPFGSEKRHSFRRGHTLLAQFVHPTICLLLYPPRRLLSLHS